MKRFVTLLSVTILFFTLLAVDADFLQSQTLVQRCCVAGTYRGEYIDVLSKTCPEPGKGKFVMYLYQEKNCGSKIYGKIEDSAGYVTKFEGTVSSAPGGCCTISCKSIPPADEMYFKALLCKVGLKWQAKKGKYTQTGGCGGTFSMVQQ